MRETSLAQHVPLWRTLREDGVTALVTPALDYVGCLGLDGIDTRFLQEDERAQRGETIRELVGGLDDEVSLLLLYRVHEDVEADIAAYQAGVASPATPAVSAYVAAKVQWLRTQHLRRGQLNLFFSSAGGNGPLDRGVLGAPLLFKNAEQLSHATHAARLRALRGLRDRLRARLAVAGVSSRELEPQDVWQLHYELLNPGRARKPGARCPDVALVDNLWTEALARREGRHVREYTEAETLCFESISEERGYFRQGGLLRRVATLKVLPEARTRPFCGQPLQALGHPLSGHSFGYTLSVAVRIRPQGRAKFLLNQQHKLVSALRSLVQQVSGDDARRAVDDADKQGAIRALFSELSALSSKLADVSVSLLLDADTLDELDARTEAARNAFRLLGNSELLVEGAAQLPCYFSLFPGAGAYQVRRKGCTTRNAADLLPLFAPWRGGAAADTLFTTPLATTLRFGLFDSSLGNAFHGLMCADTGAGKSLTAGALVTDAFIAGKDAILVDNGGSWSRLTRVLGGTLVEVTLNTSLCPFLCYRDMLDREELARTGVEQLDSALVQEVVGFLQVCVEDRELPSFTVPQQNLVGQAVARTYQERFRMRQDDRPLMGDFQLALHRQSEDAGLHPEDRALAALLVRRLDLFCSGTYARFLNRASTLRYDGRLLTFEMGAIAKDALLKRIALAAVMGTVTARAASRRNKTVCAIDEAHDYLGDSAAADAFLGKAYAKMRKFDVAMWAISQKFEDFLRSRAAATIIGNSFLKLFLWHSSGWEVVRDAFGWPESVYREFRGLQRVPFEYTDFLLVYGERYATVRHAVPPLAYWLLTTHGDDQRFLERARAKNPHLDELTLLQELAARYPGGARSVSAPH
ncbi:MAG: VirB4 family type IV secretion system protein [Myxococcaceae bacterium]